MPKQSTSQKVNYILFAAFFISAAIKLVNLRSGGPQIEVDDFTLYNGAFLVWFGSPPPQHMYIESWLCGAVCLLTYAVKTVAGAGLSSLASINVIADAYQDYNQSPDTYFLTYRVFVLAVDLSTAFLVFKTARLVMQNQRWQISAALAAVLYLFSYNTVWSGMVGRPDILVSFFGVLGLYFYFRSEYDLKSPYFLMAAVSFGLAAGCKLHGAFFTIFIAADLFRVWGIRRAAMPILVLGTVSLTSFAVSAGTLLFDPLLYAKLRILNYSDDVSPYLKWGHQFLAILKGTGWVLIPLTVGILVGLRQQSTSQELNTKIKSLLVLCVGWLLLFASIRQLRPYWMLPALPMFYLVAVYFLGTIERHFVRHLLAISLVVVFLAQSAYEAVRIHNGGHDELRQYVENTIRPGEQFFVLGYSILVLPRTSENMRVAGAEIADRIKPNASMKETFAYRHAKNWEESSQLMLFDMLEYMSGSGFDYFNFYEHAEDFFPKLAATRSIAYVILEDGFPLGSYPEIERILQSEYALDTERRGPGGGGLGMPYRIYRRK